MSRFRRLAPFLFVAVAATASYLPTFGNDFAWDDEYLVLKNLDIRSLRNVPGIFTRSWAGGVEYELGQAQNRPYFRPMAEASMALDWALGGGPNPFVFHTTNLAIHVAAALALLVWLRRLTAPRDFPSTPNRPAFAADLPATVAALLWAIHPVHTEAVSLVSYRTTLLSGLATFLVLALLGRPGVRDSAVRIVAACLAFIGGLLAKEVTLVTPGLLLLGDLAARDLDRARILRVFVPMAVIGLAYLGLRATLTAPGVYDFFDGMTPFERVAMIPRVFFLYARLLVLPHPLCPFYDWGILGIPRTWFEPDILAGLLLMAATLAGIGLAWRRAPLAALGLAFFAMALLPVSHIVPFFDAAGERFLYVPSAGIWVALVGATAAFRRSRMLTTLGRGLAVVAGIAFFALTFQRSTEWRDSETILRATVRDFPMSVSAHLGLGQLLTDSDRSDQAVPLFREVTRLAPPLAVGHGMLAVALARTGDYEAARKVIRNAPPPEPQLPSAAQIARNEFLRAEQDVLLRALGL